MCEVGELLESLIAEDSAGGIVRRIENQHAGARGYFGGDFAEVGLKFIFFFETEGHGFRPEAAGERWIDRKTGIRIENFVASLDESHHGKRESHFAAGRDEDFFARDG